MAETLFTIEQEYSVVLFAVLVQVAHYLLVGLGMRSVRTRLLTKEYLEQKFGRVHQEAFGKPIEAGGYPDNGEGRYVKGLGYPGWLDFNNAQRTHQQYKEWILTTVVTTLIAGFFAPFVSAILALVTTLGRIIYSIGYRTKGADGRLIGAILHEVPVIIQLGYIFYGCFRIFYR